MPVKKTVSEGKSPKRAVKKAAAKGSSKAPEDGTAQVNEYMRVLKYVLKKEMEAVRAIILGSHPAIRERVKWNAPSFFSVADLVTFNHRTEKHIHLVFHHPAIVKIKSSFLLGDYKDRRMMYLTDMKEIRERQAELERIMVELVELADQDYSK